MLESSLWQQLVAAKKEWIGGILEDLGDTLITDTLTTTITDIALERKGVNAFFRVQGVDFDCGFDVCYGGLVGGEEGWLTFSGYGGCAWRIQKKK